LRNISSKPLVLNDIAAAVKVLADEESEDIYKVGVQCDILEGQIIG
jgi:hypothetical protein